MRHEELSVGKLVLGTGTDQGLKSEAGADLLTSNALTTDKMWVGVGGVATAKTQAEVMNHLFKASVGFQPVYAGVSTPENDADAQIVISKTGVAATDYALAVVIAATTAVAVKKVACTLNTVTVDLTGNGGTGTSVFYVVFRATT